MCIRDRVATAVGVGIDRVDDLHAREGIEVVAIGDHAEDLLRRAVEINPGNHRDEVVELASGSSLCGRNRQFGTEH